MRVIVNENFKVFHGHVPTPLEAGQIVTGSLAELLARGARKKVTVLEDDVQEPEDTGGTGGEQDPPHPPPQPPVTEPNSGDPTTPPPPGDDELDIDAPVADVLAWVGDDKERAAEALRQEEAVDKPRSTLVKQLAKIAGE
ncbi:hypothetical protein SEA_KROMP_8 [Streptomyces phage Kromp]|uniref:Uncharacterized protein n=1 Tax=Streptomyces phage Kromp TaxID=2315619 RepID=A0A386K8L6_9CAUD|nr:hypothetical protein SEA_KROMP_8 [Streptomyces phage Kromp]